MIPTNDGQTVAFVGTTAGRMRAHALGGDRRRVHRPAPDGLPGRVETGVRRPAHSRLRGFAGQPGYLHPGRRPGLGTRGRRGRIRGSAEHAYVADAFRDAELLAGAVRDIRGGATGEAGALAGYQVQRDELAGPLFSVVESIASYRWTTAALRRMLLEASSAMTEQVEALQRLDEDQRALTSRRLTDGTRV